MVILSGLFFTADLLCLTAHYSHENNSTDAKSNNIASILLPILPVACFYGLTAPNETETWFRTTGVSFKAAGCFPFSFRGGNSQNFTLHVIYWVTLIQRRAMTPISDARNTLMTKLGHLITGNQDMQMNQKQEAFIETHQTTGWPTCGSVHG